MVETDGQQMVLAVIVGGVHAAHPVEVRAAAVAVAAEIKQFLFAKIEIFIKS